MHTTITRSFGITQQLVGNYLIVYLFEFCRSLDDLRYDSIAALYSHFKWRERVSCMSRLTDHAGQRSG